MYCDDTKGSVFVIIVNIVQRFGAIVCGHNLKSPKLRRSFTSMFAKLSKLKHSCGTEENESFFQVRPRITYATKTIWENDMNAAQLPTFIHFPQRKNNNKAFVSLHFCQ